MSEATSLQPVDSDAFFAPAHSSLGALYTPDAGYVSDPQLATSNLVDAAVRRGASTLYRRTVVGLDRVGQTWEVTLSDGQRIGAPIVVNAAGPWSPQINRLARVGADFRVTQRALRQEVHRVQQPECWRGLGDTVPIIADLDLGTYLRPDAGGGLLVGGTEPDCDPLDWVSDLEAVDYRPTLARHEAQVLRAANASPTWRSRRVPKASSESTTCPRIGFRSMTAPTAMDSSSRSARVETGSRTHRSSASSWLT